MLAELGKMDELQKTWAVLRHDSVVDLLTGFNKVSLTAMKNKRDLACT